MALFGKKKLTLEEILEGIKNLSEEEKAQALNAMQGKQEPVESEVENTESEVEQTEEVEEVEETVDDTAMETEEVKGNEEENLEETNEESVEPQAQDTTETTLTENESATDEMANDNRDAIIHQLSDRVNELSEQIKGLLDLKTLMEEYTTKQADNFGYKGNVLGAKKDYKDMSIDELKAHSIKGL